MNSISSGLSPVLKLTSMLIAVLCLIYLTGIAVVSANDHSEQLRNNQDVKRSSLIDWRSYKEIFGKKYPSFSQQVVRQKLFMTKTIQVFITLAKYKLNNIGYYLSINKYSDLTPEEEQRKLSGDSDEYPSDDEDDEIMDDEQIKKVLNSDLEEQARTMGKSTVSKSFIQNSRRLKRQKRSPMTTAMPSTLSIADLVRIPGGQSTLESMHNIEWIVPSNNPNYEPVALMTQGNLEPRSSERKSNDISEDEIKKIEATVKSWSQISMLNYISETAQSTLNWLRSNSLKNPTQQNEQITNGATTVQGIETVVSRPEESFNPSSEMPSSSEADLVVQYSNLTIKDWRTTGCIAPPYDQGECNSCYAVSTTSFLEWAFCMNQARALTPLSAQYMVSCGVQFKQESDPKMMLQFHGCNRGRSRQAMGFTENYGLELEANMPYLGDDAPCPVKPETALKRKGYIRPNVKQQVRMAANTTQLDLALTMGPIVVNFRQPKDFMAYGGGMVSQCYQRGGHAMLIVGQGLENDSPYFIIKNSFGTDWGMGGYFKFDRRSTEECIKDFIFPRVSFPGKKSQARRVKAYLAKLESRPVGLVDQFDQEKILDSDSGGLFSSDFDYGE